MKFVTEVILYTIHPPLCFVWSAISRLGGCLRFSPEDNSSQLPGSPQEVFTNSMAIMRSGFFYSTFSSTNVLSNSTFEIQKVLFPFVTEVGQR